MLSTYRTLLLLKVEKKKFPEIYVTLKCPILNSELLWKSKISVIMW